jgi:SAM-dependent methyltransferase
VRTPGTGGRYAAAVDGRARETAQQMRSLLERGACGAPSFRAALTQVAPLDRDAWIDVAFGLGPPPDDGPELPRGGVPYLPCPLDALLRIVDLAPVGPGDVLVDIGAGLGRAAAVVSLLTGASAVGVEVQGKLVSTARELAGRLRLPRLSFVQGDAADLPGPSTAGTVFLLYCPFSGERLARLLGHLEWIARRRTLRVCCVDLPLPPTPWLEPAAPPAGDLAIYRSAPPLGP